MVVMRTQTLHSIRIVLVPLRTEDADEMVAVLDDVRLYEFMGGRPLTLPELRARFAKLVRGSPDAAETWLNWIIRTADTHQPIGTMQATLAGDTADIAWVVGASWQSRGFATEAAIALVSWLISEGVRTIHANIHPRHRTSEKVAARAGLSLTSAEVDGERVWTRTVTMDDHEPSTTSRTTGTSRLCG